MFLPYEYHDVYIGRSWKSRGVLDKDNVPLFGIESFPVYGVLFFMIITSAVSLANRNFITALIASIMGIVSLIGIPFLYLALIFELFGPEKRIGFGLAIATILIITFSIVLIINAVVEFKNRKNKPKNISNDLIDTDF